MNAHHQPRLLTDEERELWRRRSAASRDAKRAALNGELTPIHDLNVPKLDPYELMPQAEVRDGAALSLFSGGGGLDLGFSRAGFTHAASYELLSDAAESLRRGLNEGQVFGGAAGNVMGVDWHQWKGVEVVHGGPPCQPFSVAGRQLGHADERNMWPAFVDCVMKTRPRAFIAENVPALASKKFADYVREQIVEPLSRHYTVQQILLRAEDYGVPQGRRRVMFVGFRRARDSARFTAPRPTHFWGDSITGRQRTLGAREALGLPDTGYDALSPTIRSTLTGPRNTTSILNSVAAQRVFAAMEIWPNGVAPTREAARSFPAENGHFRLSVPDVAILQGFPEDWPFVGATYMKLGQIGNAVPPPMGYAVASSVAAALA
ncbi:DNA cytosine methyltransferase [Nocardioides sp. HM23]|nr:DNA cytosine methyltransferase [Nocardioides sp. HM23]